MIGRIFLNSIANSDEDFLQISSGWWKQSPN